MMLSSSKDAHIRSWRIDLNAGGKKHNQPQSSGWVAGKLLLEFSWSLLLYVMPLGDAR